MQPKRTSPNKGLKQADRKDRLQPVVFHLAITTDMHVREIAERVGLPYETVRRWCKRVGRPDNAMVRVPHGVIGEHKNFSLKLLREGYPAHERVRLLKELRNAP